MRCKHLDWLDYRDKLGIGFSDKEKGKYFIGKMQNFIYSASRCPFEEQDELNFCNEIGCASLCGNETLDGMVDLEIPTGLKRAWIYLENHSKDFADFLAHIIALVNTYGGKVKDRKIILNAIKKALAESHIPFSILEENGKYFVFPKGAKELDVALVSEPLEWLKDYPLTQKEWIDALKNYSEATEQTASETADKFRKALERFFQEFFGSEKSLENLKSEYGTYLSSKGIPAEIKNNFEKLLEAYTKYMNNYAKHHDKTSQSVLEYIMYQTGNLIRLMITLK